MWSRVLLGVGSSGLFLLLLLRVCTVVSVVRLHGGSACCGVTVCVLTHWTNRTATCLECSLLRTSGSQDPVRRFPSLPLVVWAVRLPPSMSSPRNILKRLQQKQWWLARPLVSAHAQSKFAHPLVASSTAPRHLIPSMWLHPSSATLWARAWSLAGVHTCMPLQLPMHMLPCRQGCSHPQPSILGLPCMPKAWDDGPQAVPGTVFLLQMHPQTT